MSQKIKQEIKIGVWNEEILIAKQKIKDTEKQISFWNGYSLGITEWKEATNQIFSLIKSNLDWNKLTDKEKEAGEEPPVLMSDDQAQMVATLIKPVLGMLGKKRQRGQLEPERWLGQQHLLTSQIESFEKKIAYESTKDTSEAFTDSEEDENGMDEDDRIAVKELAEQEANKAKENEAKKPKHNPKKRRK